MGISRQGIHGNYRKKVGNVVARKYRGRVILSIYQPDVSNPNTPKQQTHRTAFVAKIRALNAFAGFVKKYARNWYEWGTGWSNFVKYNWNAFSSTNELRRDQLVVTRGTLLNPTNPSAAIEAGICTFSWTSNAGQGNASAEDLSIMVAYNSAKDVVIYNDYGGKRSDREGVLSLPSAWNGDNVDVYLAFHSEDETLVSESMYLGSLSV